MSARRWSVVVPVLDMAGTIGACLDALTAQSHPRDLTEIIVVDNGSTDGTPDVTARYPVRLVREATPGAPSARNRGIAEASGDFVAFTDADCVPVRTWVARLAAAAVAQEADAVAGPMTVLDPAASLLSSYSAAIGQYDSEASLRHPRYPYAVTANLAVRRSLLQSVGGFNPAFVTYDAAELFWRLLQTGTPTFAFEPRAVVFYRTRRTVRELARQNFGYGLGYARFCCTVPEGSGVARPGRVVRHWAQRLQAGFAQLSGQPAAGPARLAGLWTLHAVRETSLAAGIIAGYRRFRGARPS